jgi:heme/copper-type cytochrome/quinol oxidase subunit 3
MIRPLATEVALFLTPFVLYAAFLLATRAGVMQPSAWTMPRLTSLVIASLVLVVGSFLILAQFSGAPPGSTYVPAHVEGGKFVPGVTR